MELNNTIITSIHSYLLSLYRFTKNNIRELTLLTYPLHFLVLPAFWCPLQIVNEFTTNVSTKNITQMNNTPKESISCREILPASLFCFQQTVVAFMFCCNVPGLNACWNYRFYPTKSLQATIN